MAMEGWEYHIVDAYARGLERDGVLQKQLALHASVFKNTLPLRKASDIIVPGCGMKGG